MANYLIQVTDNGDGTWSMGGPFRSPANFGSGGTNLNTTSGSVSATTGLATAATGFSQGATNTADGLGHAMRSPSEVITRADALIRLDRSFNG